MDPRRILEDASQRRSACEIQLRGDGWVRAGVVRVERGGLVVTTSEHRFAGGEDVRVWIAVDSRYFTFQASVIRSGVPVPDRSQDGILLGFISDWTESASDGRGSVGNLVELIPPNGPAISLLEPPVHLVELAVDGLSFTVPDAFKLIFVESGTITVRLGVSGREAMDLCARVGDLSTGEGYRLYGLQFEGVEDQEAHREIIAKLEVN